MIEQTIKEINTIAQEYEEKMSDIIFENRDIADEQIIIQCKKIYEILQQLVEETDGENI